MTYTVQPHSNAQYSVVGNGPVFYGSPTACERIARELNNGTRSVCNGCFQAFGCSCDRVAFPLFEDAD